MLKKYFDYLKDNPEGYWFKRKWFGWGWTPATWEGWVATIIYVGVIIALALTRQGSLVYLYFTNRSINY